MAHTSALDGDRLLIAVKGRPRPQPRPRFFQGRVYSNASPEIREWKRILTDAFKSTMATTNTAHLTADGAPVIVGLTFLFGVKDKRKWGLPHNAKPDPDNLAKAVLDAAQDCGLLDRDQQVVVLNIDKHYADHDGMILELRPAPTPEDSAARLAALLSAIGIPSIDSLGATF